MEASTADRIVESIDSGWSEEIWQVHIQLLRNLTHVSDASMSLSQTSIDKSLDAFDEQLGEVARTIQAAEQVIRRLRSHRNRVCGVNRLPVETLCAIFESASRCGAYESVNKAITHVCSHWRTIAHSDPHLWTILDIDTMTKGYADLAVINSKGLPIHILSLLEYGRRRRNPPPNPSARVVEIVANIFHRVQVLHLKPTRTGLELLVKAAPALEELSLQPGPGDTCIVWGSQPFGEHAPALRTLVLREFWFATEARAYKNLTKLDIAAAGFHPISVEDIQLICRENPGLQSLRLHFPRGQDEELFMPVLLPVDDQRRVAMPNLHYLSLHMRLELIAQFLSITRFTQQPAEIDIKAFSARGDHVETLFAPRCMSPLLFQRLHTINVENNPQCVLRLRGFATHTEAGTCTWTVEWVPFGSPDTVTACDFEVLATAIGSSQPMPILRSFQILDFVQLDDPEDTSHEAMTNFARGAAALLVCCARSVTTFAVCAWRIPGEKWTTDSHPTSTLFANIHHRISTVDNNAPPEPLLPLLETCIFLLQNSACDPGQHACEDFIHVVPIVRLLNANIQRLEIGGAGHLAISSRDAARECVRGLRELAIPETYWDMVRFWPRAWLDTEYMDDVKGCFWPREVWPEGEAYTWKCTKKERKGRHAESPNDFCCGLAGSAE